MATRERLNLAFLSVVRRIQQIRGHYRDVFPAAAFSSMIELKKLQSQCLFAANRLSWPDHH